MRLLALSACILLVAAVTACNERSQSSGGIEEYAKEDPVRFRATLQEQRDAVWEHQKKLDLSLGIVRHDYPNTTIAADPSGDYYDAIVTISAEINELAKQHGTMLTAKTAKCEFVQHYNLIASAFESYMKAHRMSVEARHGKVAPAFYAKKYSFNANSAESAGAWKCP